MTATVKPASAIAEWTSRIQAHHAQTERVRAPTAGEDMYASFAGDFREDPRRRGDPVLERLADWISAGTTVLDVGGGAGRYALPLALRGARVTVVDPSESMLATLREAAWNESVENIEAVCATWEEADVPAADIVLCAHVLYGVADIVPFVRKLADRARDRVVILAYFRSPPSIVSPLWPAVHGEERIDLPAMPELLRALWEMEVYPNVEMFPGSPRSSPSREAALPWLRALLHVEPGSEADGRLQAALDESLEETSEGVRLKGQKPRPRALAWWATGGRAG